MGGGYETLTGEGIIPSALGSRSLGPQHGTTSSAATQVDGDRSWVDALPLHVRRKYAAAQAAHAGAPEPNLQPNLRPNGLDEGPFGNSPVKGLETTSRLLPNAGEGHSGRKPAAGPGAARRLPSTFGAAPPRKKTRIGPASMKAQTLPRGRPSDKSTGRTSLCIKRSADRQVTPFAQGMRSAAVQSMTASMTTRFLKLVVLMSSARTGSMTHGRGYAQPLVQAIPMAPGEIDDGPGFRNQGLRHDPVTDQQARDSPSKQIAATPVQQGSSPARQVIQALADWQGVSLEAMAQHLLDLSQADRDALRQSFFANHPAG